MGQRTDNKPVSRAKGAAGSHERADTPSPGAPDTLTGKVERARQQLTNVFDAVDELMFIHDRDGRILRANRVYARHAGLDYRAIIGKPYWEVFPLQDGPLPVAAEASAEGAPCSKEIATPEGLHFVCSTYPIHDKSDAFLYTLLVMRDVTAERRAEAGRNMLALALQQAAVGTAITRADPALTVTYANTTLCELSGLCDERVLEQPLAGLLVSEHGNVVETWREAVGAHGYWQAEVNLAAAGGEAIPVQLGLAAVNDESGAISGYVATFSDLREIRQARQRNQALETRFRHVVDAVPDILFMLDPATLGPTLVSPVVKEQLGFTPEELFADPGLWQRQLHADDRARVSSALADALAHGRELSLEMRLWQRDGRTLRWFSAHAVVNRDAAGTPVEVIGALSDITARKLAEEELANERDFVATVLDTTAALMVVLAPDGTVVHCNRACLDTFGYGADEVEGRTIWSLFVPEGQRQQVQAVFDNLVVARVPSFHENEWVARDGSRRLIAWSNTTLADADGGLRYVIATGVDITGKQAAERSLREANRALRTLSACNEIMVRATDESVLLQNICAAIVGAGEFAAAWVGYACGESPVTLLPMTQAGLVADAERDQADAAGGTFCESCPALAAVRTGRVVIDNDIDPRACTNPWSHCDSRSNARSQLALPLIYQDRRLGVLVIYAQEPRAFGDEEVSLLSDLANDLVYGIRSLRTEHERASLMQAQQLSNERLQRTLVKTIESLAVALEKRDPYTSGHQQRVAALAVAIAEAMGLDPDRVEGIRLGALIHDVGKIYVPSEILNRPGRLTDAEFALIKSHSEVGFEIVKQVEFPWPVAQMIRQHHERLDGSGYPDGLHDEQIILEARVLAVADVVEAMTSHRPYRPGLGVDAALEEIDRHRGTHYDPAVVDTCTQLFSEQAFSFDPHVAV